MLNKKVVNIDDFRKQEEKNRKKELRRQKVQKCLEWTERNKEEIAIALTAGAAIIGGVAKITTKHCNAKSESLYKEKAIYDRSEGHYWFLKKKLSQAEWGEISRRKNNGETYFNILTSMNVLKK